MCHKSTSHCGFHIWNWTGLQLMRNMRPLLSSFFLSRHCWQKPSSSVHAPWTKRQQHDQCSCVQWDKCWFPSFTACARVQPVNSDRASRTPRFEDGSSSRLQTSRAERGNVACQDLASTTVHLESSLQNKAVQNILKLMLRSRIQIFLHLFGSILGKWQKAAKDQISTVFFFFLAQKSHLLRITDNTVWQLKRCFHLDARPKYWKFLRIHKKCFCERTLRTKVFLFYIYQCKIYTGLS